jgi:alkylation response protein AidB-like acyl-CoA dehydrogenase
MLYNWVPEQQEVRDRVKAFCEEHVVPFSQQWDRRPPEFPEEIFQKMAKEGFVGFPSAKEYGGRGEPKIRYATLIEEMSKYDGAVGIVMAVAVLASYPIEKFGTEEQKRKYLPPMAKGTIKGAFALTEPEAGSDAANQHTTALDSGDHYLLNGEKIFITSGNVADVIVVICRIMEDENQPLEKGKVSALIFDNKKDPGYSAETIKFKMGIRASTTGRLHFKNVKIPKENLLGPIGKGFRVTMATLDSARIGVAAQALGIAQHAFDESVAYAKKRVQFGKPIADLQAIQWMVADMATRVDAARLLTYRAALLEDQGDVRFSREAAIAKLFSSETACFCADCAMQIHAGYGYCGDYSDIEHIYRDARITRIYEGTSEVQRLVIGTSYLR